MSTGRSKHLRGRVVGADVVPEFTPSGTAALIGNGDWITDHAGAVSETLRPEVPMSIMFVAGKVPRADPEEDAYRAAVTALARREVLAHHRAGHDCGLAVLSLRLFDRIDQLACVRTDSAWQE